MPGLTFHLIPHTHWDREWYLTRAAFTARLVPMLDDLLDRFDRDPWLRTFLLDGQVAGTWRYESGAISLEPFRRLSAAERRQLEAEADGLARLHA